VTNFRTRKEVLIQVLFPPVTAFPLIIYQSILLLISLRLWLSSSNKKRTKSIILNLSKRR